MPLFYSHGIFMSPSVSRSDQKKAGYEVHGQARQCQEEWSIAHRTQKVGGYTVRAQLTVITAHNQPTFH